MKDFKEFAEKVNADARLCELVDKYEQDTDSLTDEEFDEMLSRYDKAHGGLFGDGEIYTAEDLLDDDTYADMLLPADDNPIWDESPVDLFGPWWE